MQPAAARYTLLLAAADIMAPPLVRRRSYLEILAAQPAPVPVYPSSFSFHLAPFAASTISANSENLHSFMYDHQSCDEGVRRSLYHTFHLIDKGVAITMLFTRVEPHGLRDEDVKSFMGILNEGDRLIVAPALCDGDSGS